MSGVTILVSQTRHNLVATVRLGAAIALGVIMPVVFFVGAAVLFGAEALGGDSPVVVRGAGETPDLRTFYVGGFMAYAVLYAAFVASLPELVDIRERGLLKRLRGTPLPLWTFVAARLAIALAVTVIGVTAIGVTGRLAFGVTTSPAALPGVIVLTIIGTSMFLCLSFAIASFARSNSAAQGMSNGVGIVLALISGVFFAPSILPDAVGDVARYLPLEPLANSYQSLYVTDASGLGLDLGNIAVLVGWTIVAIAIVAVRGFRWKPFQQR
ncbi:MAG: ABC transporter permease [Actinomycetota bacterium]|nr:ABC transporter permease [Actinomycetota bacterium]MDA3015581.1 ABC transporter permease [Actinomycetota bacterium]MDA3028448.1 ABC transporter permease [Actinomycetota bacterium]